MRIAETKLADISVASVCLLLLIWVLPDTIALRNILLAIGGICGVALIKNNWNYFNHFSLRVAPLYLVLALFIWVLIHYAFFSLNKQLELSEIKSLWLRTFAGLLMAIGLAIALHKNSHLRKYFLFSLFFVPIINLVAYGYASYLNGGLVKPNNFAFFLFAKIETAYFGALAASIAVANLTYLFAIKNIKTSKLQLTLYLLGLGIVLLSALVSSTKNGVAIAIGLTVLLTLIIFINGMLNQGSSRLISVVTLIFILAVIGVVWQNHKTSSSRGWDTVLQDAKIAIDIDSNRQWQTGVYETLPRNSSGQVVAANTYERFAYASVGLRLIGAYPLGYGSINRSFVGLQDVAQILHGHQGQVHSGWIDFGLAFGIPGLALLFVAMLLIIGFAIAHPTLLSLCAGMICIALIPMGVIAEICYKQYFEATIFFITLASALILLEGKSRVNSIKYD